MTGPVKRALIISNTTYQKLPAIPVDHSGPKALGEALRDAQFEVTIQQDLTLDSFARLLDQFQADIRPGEICLFYYAGYIVQDIGGNYLTSVDFDPDSKDDISTIAYPVSSLQKGLAKNNPLISMLVFDANWGAPKLVGRTGLVQSDLPPHTWMLASARPNETTTKATDDHKGLFTSALIKTLPQPGLDLTALVLTVKNEVKTASKGTQYPQDWSTDVSRFYFHQPVPIGVAKRNKVDSEMYVFIPAGKFWMGCAPASEDQCKSEEKPRHLVALRNGFWLGQNEVTNDDFQAFAKTNKIKWKPVRSNTIAGRQGNLPVVSVSWSDAAKYCKWAGGRLPTEAEWERAARDGKDDAVYPYPDLATSREKANFHGSAGKDSWPDIAPVRQFDPSQEYGLYDMAGNVWEWVTDWYNPVFYQESAKESPAQDPENSDQPDKNKRHVVRGGSWDSDPKVHLRISYRRSAEPGNVVGFRCLLPDTPEVRKQLGYAQ